MEAEAVAALAGSKAMIENPSEVFCGDTDPVIDDSDLEVALAVGGVQGYPFIAPARFVTGVLGIVHEVD